jgi:tetratricopeptide (TPR) repeat protein
LLRSFGKLVIALLIAVAVVILVYKYPPDKSSFHARAVPPTHIFVTHVPKGVEVSWRPIPGAVKYTVFWGTEREDYRNLFDTGKPAVVLVNLKRGGLYYLAVTSWTSTGESNYSGEQVFVFNDVPSSARTHLSKGSEFLERGEYREAYAHISMAIELDPKDPQGYEDRALLYEKIARPDLAKKDYALVAKLYKSEPVSLVRTIRSRSY